MDSDKTYFFRGYDTEKDASIICLIQVFVNRFGGSL